MKGVISAWVKKIEIPSSLYLLFKLTFSAVTFTVIKFIILDNNNSLHILYAGYCYYQMCVLNIT